MAPWAVVAGWERFLGQSVTVVAAGAGTAAAAGTVDAGIVGAVGVVLHQGHSLQPGEGGAVNMVQHFLPPHQKPLEAA